MSCSAKKDSNGTWRIQYRWTDWTGAKKRSQIGKAEAKEKATQEVLAKHDLRAETFKLISKEVAAETKNMKSAAVPVANLFGSEEYVKVK